MRGRAMAAGTRAQPRTEQRSEVFMFTTQPTRAREPYRFSVLDRHIPPLNSPSPCERLGRCAPTHGPLPIGICTAKLRLNFGFFSLAAPWSAVPTGLRPKAQGCRAAATLGT